MEDKINKSTLVIKLLSAATISATLYLGGASGKWLSGLDDLLSSSESIQPTTAETTRVKFFLTPFGQP